MSVKENNRAKRDKSQQTVQLFNKDTFVLLLKDLSDLKLV